MQFPDLLTYLIVWHFQIDLFRNGFFKMENAKLDGNKWAQKCYELYQLDKIQSRVWCGVLQTANPNITGSIPDWSLLKYVIACPFRINKSLNETINWGPMYCVLHGARPRSIKVGYCAWVHTWVSFPITHQRVSPLGHCLSQYLPTHQWVSLLWVTVYHLSPPPPVSLPSLCSCTSPPSGSLYNMPPPPHPPAGS